MAKRNSKRQSLLNSYEGNLINYFTESEYKKIHNIMNIEHLPRHKSELAAEIYHSTPTNNPANEILPPQHDDEDDVNDDNADGHELETKLQVLQDQINELEELLEQERKKNEHLQHEYEELYQENENLVKSQKTLEEKSKNKFIQASQEYERKINELNTQIENLRKEASQLRELSLKAEDNDGQINSVIEEYEGRLQNMAIELEGLKKENEELMQERDIRVAPESQENVISLEEFQMHQLEAKKLENNLEAEKKLTAALKEKLREKSNELDRYKSRSQEETQISLIMECENRITMMATEMERLKSTVEEKDIEIFRLTQKCSDLETSRSLHITSVQGNFDSAMRTALEKELREITAQYDKERLILQDDLNIKKAKVVEQDHKLVLLSTEIERLKLTLAEFANENEVWRSKYENEKYQMNSEMVLTFSKLQEEKRGLEKEYMNARSQADLIESERNSYLTEIRNLKLSLQEKERISEALQTKVYVLEDQMHKMKIEFDMKSSNIQLIQIEDIKIKLKAERDMLEAQLHSVNSKYFDLENKVGMITTENERLNYVISQIKSDYETRLNFLIKENENLKLHVSNHKSDNEVILAVQIKENEELKRNLSAIKQEFTNRESVWMFEKSRLEEEVSRLRKEKSEFEGRISLLQSSYEARLYDINIQLTDKVKKEVEKKSANNQQVEIDLMNVRKEKERLELLVLQMKSENERLNNQNMGLVSELRQWQDKFSHISQSFEIERTKKATPIGNPEKEILLESQIRMMQDKNSDFEKQMGYLKAQKSEIELKMEEKTRENLALQNKIIRLDEVQSSQIESLKHQINSLSFQNNEVERKRYEEQTLLLSNKLKELDMRMSSQKMEYDRICNLFENTKSELDLWKSKYLALEDEYRLKKLDYEKHIQLSLTMDNEEKKKYEQHIFELKQKIIDQENKINFLTIEVERSAKWIHENKRENESLQLRIMSLEKEIEQAKNVRIVIDNHPDYLILKKHSLELEILLENMAREKEKSLKAYEETKKDLEYWHMQYKNLEREFSAKQLEWNQQINLISMQSNKDLEIRHEAEKTAMSADMLHLQKKKQDSENEMTILRNEKLKLELLLEEKFKEAESWRIKYTEIQDSEMRELEYLRTQLETYKKANIDIREFQLKFGSEKASLESMNQHLRQELETKKIELAKAYELLDVCKLDVEKYNRQYTEVTKDSVRSQSNLKVLEEEIRNREKIIEKLKKDNDYLNSMVNVYKSQSETVEYSINAKNNELKEKLSELEKVKMRYHDNLHLSGTRDKSPFYTNYESTTPERYFVFTSPEKRI